MRHTCNETWLSHSCHKQGGHGLLQENNIPVRIIYLGSYMPFLTGMWQGCLFLSFYSAPMLGSRKFPKLILKTACRSIFVLWATISSLAYRYLSFLTSSPFFFFTFAVSATVPLTLIFLHGTAHLDFESVGLWILSLPFPFVWPYNAKYLLCYHHFDC